MSLELLRFKDLRRLGVVSSWPQLRNMQKAYGFPSGLLLGANSRAWRVAEVEAWLANRPTEPSAQVMERVEKSMRARQAAEQIAG
jgi:predicted DNA-binding transcriptional regulator AlpA